MGPFKFIFLFSTLIFTFTVEAVELPPTIIAAQELKVTMGECQATWAESWAVETYDLGRNVTLWLVPCARWSQNQNTSAYLTVKESSRPEGYITKPLSFISYSPILKLMPGHIVHNPVYNPETQILESQYYPGPQDFCGSYATYQWNGPQQMFMMKILLKQDDCKNANAPWEVLYSLK